MTDPEVTGPSLPTVSVPAPPGPPASAQDPITDHGPSIGPAPAAAYSAPGAADPAPAAVAPRRRWRWAVVTLVAVVVVAGLAAGLVVWAPWKPPPVLRPSGLVAGPATANSITFRWARPPTGPLPDKYLILSSGTVAGTVAGTVTSYRQAGLTPATPYQYRVVAVRGGKRSPQSAALAVRTLTPPISQARLQGAWNVREKYVRGAHGSPAGTLSWSFVPVCSAGPCSVMLQARNGKYSFNMKMTRAGARYQGQAVVNFYRCGPRGNTIPDPTTLKVQLRVTKAAGQNQTWAATSLAGTMVGSYKYVTSATFYCRASSYQVALSG